MNLLDRIEDFGAIDAENDERLIEYFYRTPIIDEMMSYKKSIIIGRKGSGKTAIYKYIQNENRDNTSALLFKDYPWKTHDQFKNTSASDRESFVNSWTFFFYIETIKMIIKNQNDKMPRKILKAIKHLSKWLKKNWGSMDFNYREIMLPKRKKFKGIFAPSILGNSLGSIARDIEDNATNLGATLTEYNKKLESIINKILPHTHKDIILMFDELDLSYSPNDLHYKDRLIGLLITAYAFYGKFQNNVKVFIFLRNDIFNILEFQDKNKIKDNLVVFLDWDSESQDSTLSLKKLISNRIKSNIESTSDNFSRNWGEIFENKNISRNQIKWNFIIERTFIRPRDLIKFLNLSLVQAKIRLNNNQDTIDKITNEDIHAIRQEYSTFLYEELKDEINSKYPEFNKYLEVLRNIHTMHFTPEEFQSNFSGVKHSLDIKENEKVVLERLYEFGIIGFYKPGGGGYGGSEYRFQYTSEYQPFNHKTQRIRVHYGFKEFLELVEN